MRRRMITAAIVPVVLVATVAAAPARAPTRIELPAGWQPEGIAAGSANRLYVGSRPTGAVYRVDARTGRGRVLVRGRAGRGAFGLKVAAGRLWVAGGGTGRLFVYGAGSGRPVRDFRVAPAGQDTFVNDVVVTRTAAYFTDSRRSVLYVLPRHLSGPRTLRLRGVPLLANNNLNGIVATPDGRTLLAVQSNAGLLWRIDPATGRAARIDLGRARLTDGDGLLLVGRTLYVVRNRLDRIAVVALEPGLRRGRVVRTIASRRFDVPTTIARIGDRLYAVNARFGQEGPTTRYWVTRVSR